MTAQHYIALRSDMKIGARTYLPGDLFERDKIINKGLIAESTMEALKEQGYYDVLTQEKLDICLVRRPGGSPPLDGITPEILAEAGVELRYPTPPKAKKDPGKTAGGRKAHRPTNERPERVPVTAETEEHKGYKMTPKPRAGGGSLPVLWEVTASDGTPVRDAPFSSKERAIAFIDARVALANATGAATPGASKESQNGGDVQRGAD